jgi:N-carbamoylputrescine amidase
MKRFKLALCQGHWTGARDSTAALYRELIADAVDRGADMIGLPEFTLAPYFPGTRDEAGFQWAEDRETGDTARFCSQQAKAHGVYVMGSIFEVTDSGDHWDTALIFAPDGTLAHFTRKVHIPSGTGYHETDFFQGAAEFPVHDMELAKLAAPTCYDQWYPELARIYALNGAELIFYPTAIGSEPTAPDFDSRDAWQTVMRGHAVANGLFIAACNRVGTEQVTFYGSSFICDPLGDVLAEARRDTDDVIIAEIDPGVRAQYLELFPLLHQRRPTLYRRLLDEFEDDPPPRWQQETRFKQD